MSLINGPESVASFNMPTSSNVSNLNNFLNWESKRAEADRKDII